MTRSVAGSSRRRPFGVTVTALVQGLNAIAIGADLAADGPVAVSLESSAAPLALLRIGLVILGIGMVIGLLRMDRWAWVLTMLWVGFVMTLALLAYLDGEPVYVVMALCVVQVLYLNQSEVQRAFRA